MASKPLLKERVFYSTRKTTHPVLPLYSTCRPPKYKNWTSNTLEIACKAVKEGMSVRREAEEYEIPKSTLPDHVSGRVLSGSKSGQKYLSDEEEKELLEFLLGSAKIGFPRTRKDVISLVQGVLDEKGRNVMVTSGWWEGFKK